MSTAKYGYCIATTPGLRSEGTHPMSATRIGLPGGAAIATWSTREAAEAAMRDLVRREAGEDRDPAVWGGYSVRAVFDLAPNEAVNGLLAPQ